MLIATLIFFSIVNAEPFKEDEGIESENISIQERPYRPMNDLRPLSLNGAIEQGLRLNYQEQVRAYDGELLDLSWRDSFEDFWFPKLKLDLQTEAHRVGKWWSGTRPSSEAAATVNGTLSLGFDDFTLFNWGKDYLAYQNSSQTYRRNKLSLEENRRELRQDLISQYFALVYNKEVEKIYREQLQKAAFVYRINREKVGLKKVTRLEYFQARTEYLRAQGEFQESLDGSKNSDEQMATFLNDPSGTRYEYQDLLKFAELNFTLDQAKEFAIKNNPDILDQKLAVDVQSRNYEIKKRESLPLPKISVNLGTYTHSFGDRINSTTYSTPGGGSDIDVVATISATWALTGSGGLLNGRTRRTGLVNYLRAVKEQARVTRETDSSIVQLFNDIKYFENRFKVLQARLPALQKRFDLALDRYLEKQVDYNDFHLALTEMTEAKILAEQIKYFHLKAKVDLAKAIGLEEIPGHNFERLIVQRFSGGQQGEEQ